MAELSHLDKPVGSTAFNGINDLAVGKRGGAGKKKRMLTELLSRSGKIIIQHPQTGEQISRRRLLGELLWEAALSGHVDLDGRKIYANFEEWTDIVKFIYNQLDGPPRLEVDMSTNPTVNISIEQMYGSIMYILAQQNNGQSNDNPTPRPEVDGPIDVSGENI